MLSLSMLTGVAAADYSDLKPHWAEQAMEFAVQSNLMDGISEYTFAADAPATRACLVQALYRMEHAPASDTALTFQVGCIQRHHHRLQRHGISPRHLTYARAVRRYAAPLCRIQKAGCDGTKRALRLHGCFFDPSVCADRYAVGQRRGTDHRHVRDQAGDYFAAFCADDLLPAAGNRCTEAAADPFLHSLHHQTGRRDAQRDRTGPDRSPSSDPPLHGRSGLRG